MQAARLEFVIFSKKFSLGSSSGNRNLSTVGASGDTLTFRLTWLGRRRKSTTMTVSLNLCGLVDSVETEILIVFSPGVGQKTRSANFASGKL